MDINEEPIICSLDKDLLQVPGRHYNFVKQEFRTISPIEGRFNFYWQFIMGDKSDNIMGYDGVSRQTVPKKLEGIQQDMQELAHDELAIFNYVRDIYQLGDDALLSNGICLWMQRYENEIWKFPT
jgi:5'-3' exonuclease